MDERKPSRAFDPNYQPSKSWLDLEREFPNNPGIRMMAERERYLREQHAADQVNSSKGNRRT
jgi:hypothetical protein